MKHFRTPSFRSQNPFPERRGENRDFLRRWQKQRLELPWPEVGPGPDSVTALCYCFGTAEWISSHWPFFLASIREVWRCCGLLKTVFVANMEAPEFRELSARFPGLIETRIAPDLIPEGSEDIHSMSLDMDAHLAERFDTDYVLIFQDDGFPLRPGLEAFLGKHDYYGSPSRTINLLQWIKGKVTGAWPSNGGFSLRSRKCCEMGNLLFRRYYSGSSYSPSLCEDVFFSSVLPRRFKEYRKNVSIAPFTASRHFSFEGFNVKNDIRPGGACPFGFHSSRGFAYLYRNRILPSELLVPGLEP